MLDIVGIGENIRKLRLDNNYSQEELASILLVSRQAISLWESGRGMPSVDNIVSLSELFKVNIDELLLIDENSNLPETILSKHSRDYVIGLIVSNNLKFDLKEIFIYLNEDERLLVLRNILIGKIKYDIGYIYNQLNESERKYVSKQGYKGVIYGKRI